MRSYLLAQDEKRCGRCKQLLPATEYHWRTVDGERYLASYCKTCINAYRRERRVRKFYPDNSVEKHCKACGETKPRDQFYAVKKQRDGLSPFCRDCQKAKARGWADQNRERTRANVRKWQQANPEVWARVRKRSWQAAKARRRGAFVEAVDAYSVYQRDSGLCGLCGFPVEPDRFHIDHIMPLSKGGKHSYANVQIAHPGCNQRKGAQVPLGGGQNRDLLGQQRETGSQ